MAVRAEGPVEFPAGTQSVPNKERIARIGQLQDVLAVCPTDILAGSELATLLEQLGQPEKALCHWNAVLACDPNSLTAREGVARCRQKTSPCSLDIERNHAHDLGSS
jgi:hypothetical protein